MALTRRRVVLGQLHGISTGCRLAGEVGGRRIERRPDCLLLRNDGGGHAVVRGLAVLWTGTELDGRVQPLVLGRNPTAHSPVATDCIVHVLLLLHVDWWQTAIHPELWRMFQEDGAVQVEAQQLQVLSVAVLVVLVAGGGGGRGDCR